MFTHRSAQRYPNSSDVGNLPHVTPDMSRKLAAVSAAGNRADATKVTARASAAAATLAQLVLLCSLLLLGMLAAAAGAGGRRAERPGRRSAA